MIPYKKRYHWYKMYLHFVVKHFHLHHSQQTDLIQNSVQMLYTVPLVNAESCSMCTQKTNPEKQIKKVNIHITRAKSLIMQFFRMVRRRTV